MKKGIIIGILILIVVLASVRLMKNKAAIEEQKKPIDRSMIKVPVTVKPVKLGGTESKFNLPAILKAIDEVNVSLNTSGKIEKMLVNTGTSVHKGMILGNIENTQKRINLESGLLQESKAKADYERLKVLYQGKAASEVEYNNAKYNFENASIQVKQLKQQVADCNLVSPINGIVTKRNVDVGEFVNTGSNALTIVDISKLKAIIQVNEKLAYQLKEGIKVNIQTDAYPGTIFKGTLKFISPVGDESHNYEAEVLIDNQSGKQLKSGTYVNVLIENNNKDKALQIPKNALVEGIKNPYVYVVENGKPISKKVILGRDLGENIEIKGLNEGELVITSGQINITENSILEIVDNK